MSDLEEKLAREMPEFPAREMPEFRHDKHARYTCRRCDASFDVLADDGIIAAGDEFAPSGRAIYRWEQRLPCQLCGMEDGGEADLQPAYVPPDPRIPSWWELFLDVMDFGHAWRRRTLLNFLGHNAIGGTVALLVPGFEIQGAALLLAGREWGQKRDSEWHLADRILDVLEGLVVPGLIVWFRS